LLDATTGADRDQALDFITVTKLLPKVHGSRQRLEPVLRGLIDFAAGDADAAGGARLPIAMEKLERMRVTLLDAQFVSFTE
jgi:5-methylcytosine-specific restriction enzyme B